MAPASYHRSSNTVCVMDAFGQVGSLLVKRLLRRGYTVHAASQQRKELSIKGLSIDETQRLRTFYFDLFDYQSIYDAMKGCSGLFYAFHPPPDQPTYDEYMVEVEVRAAHNVLEACAQTETMEKVVFTSSVAAVIWNENHSSSSTPNLDERSWSDPNFCKKFKLWHALAKTLAEKTAWALAMDRDVTMVAINVGLLLGPELSISDPYLKGAAEMYKDGVFVTIDAEFLADAHVCAYEDISAYGRYICFNQFIAKHEDAVKLSQTLAPSAPCPPASDEPDRIINQRIHNRKLKELMEDYDIGLEMKNIIVDIEQ